jgi:hypothetical protein
MVDILTGQAVARVTLLLAVGGSFDALAAGGLADAHHPQPSSANLTQMTP